ncbi:hypothetical protein [Anaplasma capra]|nr:hypothetical protein [Anaplasma capra]MCU7612694.1 hypothetical protein [Anaplasma capra]
MAITNSEAGIDASLLFSECEGSKNFCRQPTSAVNVSQVAE